MPNEDPLSIASEVFADIKDSDLPIYAKHRDRDRSTTLNWEEDNLEYTLRAENKSGDTWLEGEVRHVSESEHFDHLQCQYAIQSAKLEEDIENAINFKYNQLVEDGPKGLESSAEWSYHVQ